VSVAWQFEHSKRYTRDTPPGNLRQRPHQNHRSLTLWYRIGGMAL